MEDKFVRYSKLYVLLFLLFLSVPVIIGLIIGAFYGISRLFSSAPIDLVYELFILSIPAAVFSAVYVIFFRRTAWHPVWPVRFISKTIFLIGMASCALFLVWDMITFFKHHGPDISGFYCYNTYFLSGNIAAMFLVAIMQAFTTEKELDWVEKRRGRDVSSLN